MSDDDRGAIRLALLLIVTRDQGLPRLRRPLLRQEQTHYCLEYRAAIRQESASSDH